MCNMFKPSPCHLSGGLTDMVYIADWGGWDMKVTADWISGVGRCMAGFFPLSRFFMVGAVPRGGFTGSNSMMEGVLRTKFPLKPK